MDRERAGMGEYVRLAGWAAIVFAAVYVVASHLEVIRNVIIVAIGFGAVIMIHEFGHFSIAKLSGMKVEAFSIGFPPVLVGILRTEKGYRVRVLPGFARREDGERAEGDDGSVYWFMIGKKAKPGETEYRIGLIPFGGFVKVLGQEDVKAAEATSDPRAYMNRPVWARMLFAAGGVTFNVVSAVLVFMVVFLAGVRLTPAVVGGVAPGSPAAQAGLQAGDEILAIGGKSFNLDFMNIREAAAFSEEGEKVAMKVRRRDGEIEEVHLESKMMAGSPVKVFGIDEPASLTIAQLSNESARQLYERTGLLPGALIVAVNGKDIEHFWQFGEAVGEDYGASVTIAARQPEGGENELVRATIPLEWAVGVGDVNSEAELSEVYSMVPRLKIAGVNEELKERTDGPKVGDIIVGIGDVNDPTYLEMRKITEAHKDKELELRLLRKGAGGEEEAVKVTVVPKEKGGEVQIGLALVLDAGHTVVAKTIEAGGDVRKLDIPRGARIEKVDGEEVSSFYEVVEKIRARAGERVSIEWRLNDLVAGGVGVTGAKDGDYIRVRPMLGESLPQKPLTKLYKAQGPLEAVRMGFGKGVTFIRQAYMTLRGFVAGQISAKSFMGPVGILTLSYKVVAEESMTFYLYWLGLISAFIAVFNSLPMLPFDGGHVLFLAIEKIKGSPVSERVQAAAVYVGLALVLAFVIYVTWNDIWRLIRGTWF